MGNFLYSLLAFIVAISVLIAIHEYGHYIVGRWAGMKVLRFSIGFGKPIWTWVRGADRTEYCISSIPLGGYVRFLDSREGPIPPEDEGRAFNHRPVPWRIAVLLAGPMFNFVFAIFAYWLLSMDGVPALRPAVGEVTPQSYAAEAGLETGDQIVAIGDTPTDSWQQALMAMFDNMVADGRIPMTLEDQRGQRRQAQHRHRARRGGQHPGRIGLDHPAHHRHRHRRRSRRAKQDRHVDDRDGEGQRHEDRQADLRPDPVADDRHRRVRKHQDQGRRKSQPEAVDQRVRNRQQWAQAQ